MRTKHFIKITVGILMCLAWVMLLTVQNSSQAQAAAVGNATLILTAISDGAGNETVTLMMTTDTPVAALAGEVVFAGDTAGLTCDAADSEVNCNPAYDANTARLNRVSHAEPINGTADLVTFNMSCDALSSMTLQNFDLYSNDLEPVAVTTNNLNCNDVPLNIALQSQQTAASGYIWLVVGLLFLTALLLIAQRPLMLSILPLILIGFTVLIVDHNPATASTAAAVKLGDADCDGAVTVIDMLLVDQYAAGAKAGQHLTCPDDPTTAVFLPACDANISELCTRADMLLLAQCDVRFANEDCGGLQNHTVTVEELLVGGTVTVSGTDYSYQYAFAQPVPVAHTNAVCHAADVTAAPALVRQSGANLGVTNHDQCRPDGMWDSGHNAPFCEIYDDTGREAMTAERRVVGYFDSTLTGKNGDPAYLVPNLPWGKLTHLNYMHGFVDVADNYSVSVNREPSGNASVDMEWPEYGLSVADGTMSGSSGMTGHFELLRQYKAMYPDVKLLFSVGGYDKTGGYFLQYINAGGFYAMTTDQDGTVNDAGITAFSDSVVQFLRDYPFFDGIDIDYQYPTSMSDVGHSNDYSHANSRREGLNQSYSELMRMLRWKLDGAAVEDGRYYQLTATSTGDPLILRGMELYETATYIDFLNLNSFDYHGSWNPYVEHHAPLFDNGADSELAAWSVYDASNPEVAPYDAIGSLNADWSTKYYRGALPPSRINLGVPLYTRGWQAVEGGTNGLSGRSEHPDSYGCGTITADCGERYIYNGDGAVGIDNIWRRFVPKHLHMENGEGANPLWHVKNLEAGGDNNHVTDYVAEYADPSADPATLQMAGTYTRFYDDVAAASWLWNAEKQVFLSMEDAESVQAKLDYVIDNRLGGITLWDLAGDYSDPADFATNTAAPAICQEAHFIGSTLTSMSFDALQNTTESNTVQNPRPMPVEAVDVTVELHSFPLGNDNYPVNPQLRIVANSGADLSNAIIEFDVPTSTPDTVREYWGTSYKLDVTVVESGHVGPGNVGGLDGDFHRVRVELKSFGSIGSSYDSGDEGLLFYVPFSGISAVTISFDGGDTFYAILPNLPDPPPPPPSTYLGSCHSAGRHESEFDTWSEGDILEAGDLISHDGHVWQINWWTLAEPGTEPGAAELYCTFP